MLLENKRFFLYYLIAKSFDQHVKRLSLSYWIKDRMQKAVLLETARIVRRFLRLEVPPSGALAIDGLDPCSALGRVFYNIFKYIFYNNLYLKM